ncbi:MAG TPA: NAD-dependent protein deacetylase [Polyangia bacterium]|nr:NAD-dependent protein deacetylase [Polyangia bacterium]
MNTTVPTADGDLDALASLLRGRRLVALTGAGCSTESGIPDYRGAGRSPTRTPIQHDAFLRRAEVRRRYWARATVGWARFHGAQPNAAHDALAALEQDGALAGVITQNVDRLHAAAGSRWVVELHGALEDVRCLACGGLESRAGVHRRLLAANPGWLARAAGEVRPDGDAELPEALVEELQVVGCVACVGALKPDVVFFGGNVPEATLNAAWALFDQAEALLVVGSSLAVWSGYRFVRRARERGVPVAIVNLGPTRADGDAAVRIAARAGALLPALVPLLCRPDQVQARRQTP